MTDMSYRKLLVEYLRKNLVKGYPVDSLRYALINQGYPRALVELAIEEANKELAKRAPVLKEKPVIKYEIIDENDNPVVIKKPWWKKVLGL